MDALIAVIAGIIVLASVGVTIIVYRRGIAGWYSDLYRRTSRDSKSRVARSFTPSSMVAVGCGFIAMGILLPIFYFGRS